MGKLRSWSSRIPNAVKAGTVPAAMWLFLEWGLHPFFGLFHRVNRAADLAGWIDRFRSDAFRDAINGAQNISELALILLVFSTAMVVSTGLVVRHLARARVRARFADPLEAARRVWSKHPLATRALLAMPGLAWAGLWLFGTIYGIGHWGSYSMYGHLARSPVVHAMHDSYNLAMGALGALGAAAGFGIYALGRAGSRALFSPVDIEPQADLEETVARVHFDAVAVTPETRAAVAAMALLPLAVVLAGRGLSSGQTELLLATYVATAIGGVLGFRRASRVTIGYDGIYVGGSSRPRFFAYRAIDAARSKGSGLELLHGERVVLVLQLHGKDAAHHTALLERISQAIAKAHEGESAAAGQVVLGASEKELTRLAGGAADYRAPALTREQLWELVEGPEHDRATREAAAKALAVTGDSEERERLRVAAEHHAEPRSRVVLKELAMLEDEDELAEPGGFARFVR
jgi:hypothetical protein